MIISTINWSVSGYTKKNVPLLRKGADFESAEEREDEEDGNTPYDCFDYFNIETISSHTNKVMPIKGIPIKNVSLLQKGTKL